MKFWIHNVSLSLTHSARNQQFFFIFYFVFFDNLYGMTRFKKEILSGIWEKKSFGCKTSSKRLSSNERF